MSWLRFNKCVGPMCPIAPLKFASAIESQSIAFVRETHFLFKGAMNSTLADEPLEFMKA